MWPMKDKLTDAEAIDCQLAHYNTFLADKQGRAVLCDMMHAAGMFDMVDPERAQEYRANSNLIKAILSKCGIDDPMAMINSFAVIAKGWRPEPKQPETDPLETGNLLD